MTGWDLPGWDYSNVSNIHQWSDCQSACDTDPICQAWTFVRDRPLDDNCFLKSGVPLLAANTACVSGVKPRDGNEQLLLLWIYIDRRLSQLNPDAAHGSLHAPLWIDQPCVLSLTIFIDHSVIEVFEPVGGRLAITARVYPEETDAVHLAVYANDEPRSAQIDTIDVWQLNSIWT